MAVKLESRKKEGGWFAGYLRLLAAMAIAAIMMIMTVPIVA